MNADLQERGRTGGSPRGHDALHEAVAMLCSAFAGTKKCDGVSHPCRCRPTNWKGALRAAFPDAEIVVTDLKGDGDHYRARVVSPAFAGVGRVKQHQMVYAALKGRMGGELHALALETAAPSLAG